MPNRQIVNGEPYRYAYQGEFAETDPETGKPAFQLRLWDARIGRWLTTDPAREFYSPYLGMGNTPINAIDPDGAFFGRLSAWLYKATNGLWGYDVEKNVHGDWIVGGLDRKGNIDIRFAKDDSPFYTAGGNAWNNGYTRFVTGDKLDLSFGAGIGSGFGAHLQYEFNWILRGKDASFLPYFTLLPNAGGSIEIGAGPDVSAGVAKGHFLGRVQDLDATDLLGPEVFAGGTFSTPIGGAGVEVSVALDPQSGRPTFINYGIDATWGAKGSLELLGARASMVRIHPTKGLIGYRKNRATNEVETFSVPWK